MIKNKLYKNHLKSALIFVADIQASPFRPSFLTGSVKNNRLLGNRGKADKIQIIMIRKYKKPVVAAAVDEAGQRHPAALGYFQDYSLCHPSRPERQDYKLPYSVVASSAPQPYALAVEHFDSPLHVGLPYPQPLGFLMPGRIINTWETH
ncbi:hypothetical protein Tco_0658089 [Tanacetum coccineum]